jgi:hypothetical protein
MSFCALLLLFVFCALLSRLLFLFLPLVLHVFVSQFTSVSLSFIGCISVASLFLRFVLLVFCIFFVSFQFLLNLFMSVSVSNSFSLFRFFFPAFLSVTHLLISLSFSVLIFSLSSHLCLPFVPVFSFVYFCLSFF